MIYTQEELGAMSDFEINCAVTSIVNNEDYSQWAISADGTSFYHCGNDGSQYHSVDILGYCNDPSDMMPLVFESLISIEWDAELESDTPSKWCNVYLFDKICLMHQSNPLRAAAIVYILIKQGDL